MAEILSFEESVEYIENIICDSAEKLNLIMPVFVFSEKVFILLEKAAERGVIINLVFSTDELTPAEKGIIAGLKNIRISIYPGIESRCYYNENTMLFSSINLHDITDNKNGEMSVLIQRDRDVKMFDKASSVYSSVIASSVKVAGNHADRVIKAESEIQFHGFCVICAMPISFNVNKPYCRQCLKYNENSSDIYYCHSCAEQTIVVKSNPLCEKCSRLINCKK